MSKYKKSMHRCNNTIMSPPRFDRPLLFLSLMAIIGNCTHFVSCNVDIERGGLKRRTFISMRGTGGTNYSSAIGRNKRTITNNSRAVVQSIRGGGSSPPPPPSSSSSSSWTSSPLGIRKTETQPWQRPSQEYTSFEQQQQEARESSSSMSQQQETKEVIDAFLTRDSRNTFIARVYAILSCQLVVTTLFVSLFGTRKALRTWMFYDPVGKIIPALSVLVSTIVWFVICTSASARRKSPIKWQLLTLFTLGESISVGFLSSFYHFKTVVTAMLSTAIALISVTFYTVYNKNSKYDLSQWGRTLSTWATIFVVYGIIQMLQITGVLPPNFLPYDHMLYSLLGTGLFSLFLAYHTKMIVAGKHTKYQMNEKDYVFASMTLYMDIINMFIYILRLVGEDRDDL